MDYAFYASNKSKCKACVCVAANAYRALNLDAVRLYDRIRGSIPHRAAARARVFAEYKASLPNRIKANAAVNNAVRDGRLKRQPCWVCGENAVAHHPDYSAPLDVVWLCQAHYMQAHALVRAAA